MGKFRKKSNDLDDWGFSSDSNVYCLHCERVFPWTQRRWGSNGGILCAHKDCDGNPVDFKEWHGDYEPNKEYGWGEEEYNRHVDEPMRIAYEAEVKDVNP